MDLVQLKIGGFGGQGVILSGLIIGKAAALFDRKHSAMTQSFGPEARGSACSVQLIVSREPVLYPYLEAPHFLVTISQEAYRKFSPKLRQGGTLIIEEELVRPDSLRSDIFLYKIPATRLAEELKRKMVLNMVMVGFFTAVTSLLTLESARRAVSESVPPGTEALNLAAMEKGYAYGMAQLSEMVAQAK